VKKHHHDDERILAPDRLQLAGKEIEGDGVGDPHRENVAEQDAGDFDVPNQPGSAYRVGFGGGSSGIASASNNEGHSEIAKPM